MNNTTCWQRFLASTRGVAALETALAFPILLAIGALCADMFTVSVERERMEQRAGALVSVLALQSDLTQEGLQGLLDSVLSTQGMGEYQLLISNVRQTGAVYWQLERGNTQNLCPDNQVTYGETYPGELPEKDSENGSENVAMLVVELCRQGQNISLLGGMSLSNMLHTTQVNRTADGVIGLDITLGREAGQPEEEYSDDDE